MFEVSLRSAWLSPRLQTGAGANLASISPSEPEQRRIDNDEVDPQERPDVGDFQPLLAVSAARSALRGR